MYALLFNNECFKDAPLSLSSGNIHFTFELFDKEDIISLVFIYIRKQFNGNTRQIFLT